MVTESQRPVCKGSGHSLQPGLPPENLGGHAFHSLKRTHGPGFSMKVADLRMSAKNAFWETSELLCRPDLNYLTPPACGVRERKEHLNPIHTWLGHYLVFKTTFTNSWCPLSPQGTGDMSPSLYMCLDFMRFLFPVEVQLTWSLPARMSVPISHWERPEVGFAHLPS